MQLTALRAAADAERWPDQQAYDDPLVVVRKSDAPQAAEVLEEGA